MTMGKLFFVPGNSAQLLKMTFFKALCGIFTKKITIKLVLN